MSRLWILMTLLAAAPAAAQTAFIDSVIRTMVASGASFLNPDIHVVDDNGDGFPDTWVGAPANARVFRFDGVTGAFDIFRGPTGSRYGAFVRAGEIVQSGQHHVAIMSTRFGAESLIISDRSSFGSFSRTRALPPGTTGITWMGLWNGDQDVEMEVVFTSMGWGSGLGALLEYDFQSDAFSVLASGAQIADEFGVSGAVVRRPGSTDVVAVAASGNDTLYAVDRIRPAPLTFSLSPGSGAGRGGMRTGGGDTVIVSSETQSFTIPSGRLDEWNIASNILAPLVSGQPADRFRPSGRPLVTEKVWSVRERVGVRETVEELDPGSTTPTVSVDAPPNTGLFLAGRGRFQAMPGVPNRVLAVGQQIQRSVSWFDPDEPLDLRSGDNRIVSGNSLSVRGSFGSSAAGGSFFPLVSGLPPVLQNVPALGTDIAFTADPLTSNSLGFVNNWPFVPDAQGEFSFSFDVPFTGSGGAIFELSFGTVGLKSDGSFAANRDPVLVHVILQ